LSEAISTGKPFGRFERSLAWRYLRAKREHGGASLIAIISFVGIALAVAALIVTVSLMTGFRQTLVNSLIGGQGHIIVSMNDLPLEDGLDLIDVINELDGIESVSPIIEEQVLLSANGAQAGAAVRGVRPEDLSVYPSIEAGEIVGFGEGRKGGNTIIMGTALAARLGISKGSRVTLLGAAGAATAFGSKPTSKEYVVGGFLSTGSVELDGLYIFMPFEQAQLFFRHKGTVPLLDVRLEDYLATDEAKRAIADATGNRFYIRDWKQQNAGFLGALQTESGVMRIIMLVLITITSLNIITGVVMLVKNKTRDIAILRTIGAGRGAVMRVFMTIGATLGFAGAVTGLVIGTLLVINIDSVEWVLNSVTGGEIFPADVYGLDGLPAELDWTTSLTTTAYAVLMSILVSIPPARWAAKLDPVDALRFE
jgi:lipoprotein-releasing system permease protein